MSEPTTYYSVVAAVCGLVGVVLTKVVEFLVARGREQHQAEKDASQATLEAWAQISREQSEFRQRLQDQIDALQKRVETLVRENESRRNEVAELRLKNMELVAENEALKARIAELETDFFNGERH